MYTEQEPQRLPRGKQPRNLQDRSKYGPHQNYKECARRIAQILEGRLDVPEATKDAIANRVVETLNTMVKEATGSDIADLEVPETPEDQKDRG